MRMTLMALLVGMAATARAGVMLTMETVDSKGKTTNVSKVEADRFRAETNGGAQVVIYRKDTDAFWMLDPAKKSWTEMTRQDIEAMSQRMDGAMKQMEEQMKDLPPAQRAQIEAMMKGRMGAGASAAPTYRKIASGQKVGSWVATQYAVLKDGKKTGEVFHADAKAIGLTEADFAVFNSIASLFKSLTRGFEAAEFYRPGKANGDAPAGVLVRHVRFSPDGKPGAVTTLTAVSRGAIPVSDFDVPSGYKKEKSPVAGGPPGGEN